MAGPGDKCEQKTESRGFCNKKGIRRQVVAMPTKVIGMIQGLRAKEVLQERGRRVGG